ncbi:MAG: cell wall metabolism sensor histidine kinase WalK [Candidatus Eremiobacteraeota bacterium]|nr:cell wall metabolism sensor histidine kinase WalK [Candidatus Eremiobacteraeota bacterium]
MISTAWLVIVLAVGLALGALIALRIVRKRVHDVRNEHPIAEEPARSDSDFVRLVDALPLGVVFVDKSARIRFANPAAGTIFAFNPERGTGAHILTSIPNIELERRIEDALRGEASVATLTLAAGSRQRSYRVSVYPLEDGGEVNGVVVFADDQTDLVRLDRARKEFLSNVSHELRTPLSSIKLMLETVIESPDDEAADLFLPQVLAQVDRLAQLVQQLLEHARAESGQLRLHLRDIDLEEVAHPIVASFEPQASHKGVHLELQAMRPVRLEADPDRLAQIFVNLVDNALRHTPAGGSVTMEIDAEGGEAILRVRDTGVGIPYRDLPHVFERFYVVDRSRTRESGGAGLGLSIVKGIVDAHGGTISAESMLGTGAVFTVRLPIMRIAKLRS